jgi:hypothetical protein
MTEGAGRLDDDTAKRFRFRYRDMAFQGDIDPTGPDTARLRLTGILGALPYSVESPALRQLAQSLLAAADAAGADYIALSGDNYVTFHRDCELARPVKPLDAIAATAEMIARVQPVILLFHSLLSLPRRPDA